MASIDTTRKESLSPQCTEIIANFLNIVADVLPNDKPKYWTPPALRAPVLIFTVATCWALIVVLEVLLHKSQRDNGLIFAPKINDLPLSETFLYLYFPTILTVIFSIYWAWIDLETKRMEPYYQLSKKDGALGKESLLLHYPFSFIPFVPFRAFRDRHWPVFWASLAVVLITWGLVPTQAGIFSVKTHGTARNVLAVSFAGLFTQMSIDMRHPHSFQPPYQLKFLPINGSIGPGGTGEWSGAYQGGAGEDQFLIAESNFTTKTPLPAWTDASGFYLPMFKEGNETAQGNLTAFEIQTSAIGAELECSPLVRGKGFDLVMSVGDGESRPTAIAISAHVTVPSAIGNAQCATAWRQIRQGPVRKTERCVEGASSLELTSILWPRANATAEEKAACEGKMLFGWLRFPEGPCNLLHTDKHIDEAKTLFVQCQSRIMTGSANIRIDASGRLQHPAEVISMTETPRDNGDIDGDTVMNLIGQSNRYLIRKGLSGFHNDSFSDDYLNYFIGRDTNSSRLVDPHSPSPTFEEAVVPLQEVYSRLFAIWLATNKKKLFVPHTKETMVTMSGNQIVPERRLFLSPTMFIISKAILCNYIIVAIWVYVRRPGQYLARLPTSIAAIIALFAASVAMQGTSNLDKKGRAKHLERVDVRYGYVSFVGGDGRIHMGIEKTLFVRAKARKTWLERKLPFFRRESTSADKKARGESL